MKTEKKKNNIFNKLEQVFHKRQERQQKERKEETSAPKTGRTEPQKRGVGFTRKCKTKSKNYIRMQKHSRKINRRK